MSRKSIWGALKAKGLSDVAVASIMGQMEAESNCESSRLQGDFSGSRYQSLQYTRDVDAGRVSRSDFAYRGPNGGGYGLCQWTYPSRKEGLYDLAKAEGTSIGDEQMQVNWFWAELNSAEYLACLNTCKTSNSIREICEVLLRKYERPADQSEGALQARIGYANDFYARFSGSVPDVPEENQDPPEGQDPPDEQEPDAPTTPFWPPRMLCSGMVGSDVGVLQWLLIANGYKCEDSLGTFGTYTNNSLIAYQVEHGLDADGIAGPRTWGAMGVKV